MNFPSVLTAPTVLPSGLAITEVSDTQFRVSWTNGNGVDHLIVIRASASANATPVYNTTYTANSVFGSGTNLGSSNYAVYKGRAGTILVTGLTASTDYTVTVYGLNVASAGSEKYSSAVSTTQTTLPPQIAPTTQATNLVFAGLDSLSMTRGNGLFVLTLANNSGAINGSFLPVDNTTYAVGDSLGGGNYVIAKGSSATYSITVSLPFNTLVAMRGFEFNIASGNPKYNTNTATGNPITYQTPAEVIWYSPKWAIAQPRRDVPHPETVSNVASKSYSGSFIEINGYRHVYVVDDNTNDVPSGTDLDKMYIRRCLLTDDPIDPTKWDWHATVDGEPVTVLDSNYLEESTARQNISSVTSGMGGLARFNFASAHPFSVLGRLVRIAGTTNYNGDAILAAQSNTVGNFWIELTGVNYVSSQTGTAVYVEGSQQNWLGTITQNGSGTLIAYRSINWGNNGARYGMGKCTVSSDGQTITRLAPLIIRPDANHDSYQFCQAFYDSDLNEIVVMVPNARDGTENRWTKTNVYRSTDSGLGETFTLLASDIFNGTTLDEAGFGLHGPLWKSGGRYHWYMCDVHVPAHPVYPGDAKTIYPYLNNRIVEVSCDTSFATDPRREAVIYQTPGYSECAIFPGSKIFTHGGASYIVMNTFKWRIEGNNQSFYQETIDVKLLTNVQPSGTLVGRDVYPTGLFRLYLPNVTSENSSIGSAPSGLEVITDTALTNVGSPIQDGLNRVNYANGYQTGVLTGYGSTSLAIKMSINPTGVTPADGLTRGLLSKLDVIELSLYQGLYPQIRLKGTGGEKLYRAPATIGTYKAALYETTDFWGVAYLNAGVIELAMGIDYTTITPTKVIDNTLTAIADNSNLLLFGRVSGQSDYTKEIKSVQVWSGSNVTVDTILKESVI